MIVILASQTGLTEKSVSPFFLPIFEKRGAFMGLNDSLNNAKKQKNDEFYTRIEDIISEIGDHEDYCKHFKGKTVYLNCDSEKSNFWRFFRESFYELGLKKLIATHYEEGKQSYKLEWSGELLKGKYTVNMIKSPLEGDGDFRSDECVEILKSCDIVVTNPPFSLFREYVAQLIQYKKKFIILGNINAVTYKEIFPLIKNNQIWLGYMKPKVFVQPDGTEKKFGNTPWYTNFDITKRHDDLDLSGNYYSPEKYTTYDNYTAIEVSKTADIPCDYSGVMGVPISFLYKHNQHQFEIVGATESEGRGFSQGLWHSESKVAQPLVDGQKKYKRIFIRRKQLPTELLRRG